MIERTHRFLQRRVRVEAVRIEDIDIVEPHPLQRLVAGRDQVFPAAPFAIRSGPHEVTGLRRNDQLIAISLQIGAQKLAESLFRATRRRAVIVGEVEMGDPVIEGRRTDGALGVVRRVVAEIVPQPERDRRQVEAGPAAAPVDHILIAVFCRHIGHGLPFSIR
jgi:hypothetical protein